MHFIMTCLITRQVAKYHNYTIIIIIIILYYSLQRKIFFKAIFFLYSLCPSLEGIKDELFYKFRRLIIVVPCAQMRLPGPRAHRDAFSSSSERRKRRAFRQACLAGHRASSEARGDVRSFSWSGGRFE